MIDTHCHLEQPDFNMFPCLALAIDAGKNGGSYPTVLCASDEIAVSHFLSNTIKFTAIADLIKETLGQHQSISHPKIEDIIAADDWARRKTLQLIRRGLSC